MHLQQRRIDMYYELNWYEDEDKRDWKCKRFKARGLAFKEFDKLKNKAFYISLTQYNDHDCIVDIWDSIK